MFLHAFNFCIRQITRSFVESLLLQCRKRDTSFKKHTSWHFVIQTSQLGTCLAPGLFRACNRHHVVTLCLWKLFLDLRNL